MSSLENHPKVAALLKAEQALPVTCYSISWLDGLREGLSLNLDKVHGPHLVIGNEIMKRSSTAGCLYQMMGDGTVLVRRAQIEHIKPHSYAPFWVLERIKEGYRTEILVYVSWAAVLIQGKKKISAKQQDLHLYAGLSSFDAGVIAVGYTDALLRFTKDGQYAEICQPNGLVQKIVFQGGVLTEVKLTSEEMATARVVQANAALARVSEDRARHGIIGGIIRLLPVTAKSLKARTVILDFLSGQGLTSLMRRNIQGILDGFHDPRALEFTDKTESFEVKKTSEASPGKVVNINVARARKKLQEHFSGTGEKSKPVKDRKAERRQRDRDRTAAEHARAGGRKEPKAKAAGGKKGK